MFSGRSAKEYCYYIVNFFFPRTTANSTSRRPCTNYCGRLGEWAARYRRDSVDTAVNIFLENSFWKINIMFQRLGPKSVEESSELYITEFTMLYKYERCTLLKCSKVTNKSQMFQTINNTRKRNKIKSCLCKIEITKIVKSFLDIISSKLRCIIYIIHRFTIFNICISDNICYS